MATAGSPAPTRGHACNARLGPSSLVLERAVPMRGEDDLAARVRACLAGVEGVSEMKMFGGVGFPFVLADFGASVRTWSSARSSQAFNPASTAGGGSA